MVLEQSDECGQQASLLDASVLCRLWSASMSSQSIGKMKSFSHALCVSACPERRQLPFHTDDDEIACGVLGTDSDEEEVDVVGR